MEKFTQGLYGDPRDPTVRREVMNMLQDAIVEDVFSDTRLDETVARNENMLIYTNQVEQVRTNPYDGHVTHVKEHNRFRKSHDYQKLKYENQKLFVILEGRFEEHMQQHHAYIAEQERKMLAQQIAMKGGGKSA